MMDDLSLKLFYNQLDPAKPLSPTSHLYVDIDHAFGEPDARVRGRSFADRMEKKFRLANGRLCEYVTGLPGSGKTTELTRVAEVLESKLNYCVARIDAQDVLDLTTEIDISVLLAILVHRTERRVLELEGKNPDEALGAGYMSRLWDWLNHTDVTLKGAQVGASAGGEISTEQLKLRVENSAKLDVELKTRPTLRQKVRDIIDSNFSHFLDQVRDDMNLLEQRAVARGRTGLVVVFDGLEKLQGTFTSQSKVQQSAEHVFVNGREYLRSLPVHTIFTIPTYLLSRAANLEHSMIPMLKLRERNGSRFDAGYRVAREIIRRRITDDGLRDLLGPDCDRKLEEIIEKSGGFPRDFLRALRELLLGDLPATEVALRRTLNEMRDGMRNVILTDHYAWLAQVARTKQRDTANEQQREAANQMLGYSVVLCYLNSEEWWDVHPLVREIPSLLAEIERSAPLGR